MALKKLTKEEQKKRMLEILETEKKMAEKAGEVLNIGTLRDFDISNRENYILTGVLGIDANTNGIKRGTWNVLYGAESSGKSTIALEIIAAYQMINPDDIILYVDSEQTVDDAFLDRIPGLKKENIIFIKDVVMEKIFDKIAEFTKEGVINFIVIDSIDTMITLKEEEKSLEDNVMMTRANVLSRGMAKINSLIYKQGIPVILIQQMRINFMGMIAKNGRSGGNALKYYPATINLFSKSAAQNEKQGDEVYGDKVVNQYCKIKNEKSKISEPLKETYTYLNTDRSKKSGVSKTKELFDFAVAYGLIESKGAWCYYTDMETGEICKVNGKNQMIQALNADLDLYTNLKLQVYGKILPPELFIVKFEELKQLLEKENMLIKKNKMDKLKVMNRENLISEKDKTILSLKDKVILDIITQEELDLGTFILKKDEEKDEFVKEIEAKNKLQNANIEIVSEIKEGDEVNV